MPEINPNRYGYWSTCFLLVSFLNNVMNFNSMIFALWPIWGFLTPILMFILFMGGTMFMVFLPSGLLGTLMFWGIMIFLVTASHLIPHEAVDGDHSLSLNHTASSLNI